MKKLLSLVLLLALVVTLVPAAAFAAPPAQEPTCEQVVTVQANDWLSKLAEKYFGNTMAYPAIVEATNQKNAADASFAKIANPDLIEPGWKLCIVSAADAKAILAKAPAAAPAPAGAPTKLRLATTTSTADTGLLDAILPDFEAKYNAKVDVVAVGTGQAIAIGSKGDADVLLVHARASEDKFVADGHAPARYDVMYNDFIIVGPTHDPAGIKGLAMAADAFKKIAAAHSLFASRGDESGTHTKEKGIWAKAGGFDPAGGWYLSLGQGMGATLTTANEKMAYTLTDRGTYLSMKDKLPNLVIMVGGNNIDENKDKSGLYNPYGVLPVSPEKHPGVNYDLATKFVEWLTSVDTQKKIGEFGKDKFGQPLFYPDSEAYRATKGS
jgi:tungstate transport system substrate-binding protein